jgi:hypothetical protein
MQDFVPGFMKFVTRPWYGLVLRLVGACLIVVGLVAAGLNAAWAGFTPAVWILLALAAFLGVICNELAQMIARKEAREHAGGDGGWKARGGQVAVTPTMAPAVAPQTPTGPVEGADASEPSRIEVEIYCVKCRDRRMIGDPQTVTLANGRPAYQGSCPVCGTKVTRILKK